MDTSIAPSVVDTLPTLYKRNSNGSVNQWTISVESSGVAAVIITTYGQVGGAMQTTRDLVVEGKNVGKRNATTPMQQALKEARAKWEKEKKRGYVETLAAAEAGEVDGLIEGGVDVMTAKSYGDYADDVEFPVAVQPKLDGHRCVAIVDVIELESMPPQRVASVTLWTRTRKRIKSVPHIEQALTAAFANHPVGTYILDGELYLHHLHADFEKLSSLIRHDGPVSGSEQLEYHVYDVIADADFLMRFKTIEHTFDDNSPVKLVETHICPDAATLASHYDYFRKQNYEGAMVRRLDVPYQHKRTDALLKMKDFLDAEARIIGIEEGRGKLRGHVGAFVCEMPSGVQFNVKLSGSTEKLKEAFENPTEWIGQTLRYRYQNLTADGKPRFPVGIARVPGSLVAKE